MKLLKVLQGRFESFEQTSRYIGPNVNPVIPRVYGSAKMLDRTGGA
jgi:hypothetical protein